MRLQNKKSICGKRAKTYPKVCGMSVCFTKQSVTVVTEENKFSSPFCKGQYARRLIVCFNLYNNKNQRKMFSFYIKIVVVSITQYLLHVCI